MIQSGLATLAHLENEILTVLAAPPVERPVFVACADGAIAVVTKGDGLVRAFAASEAGAIIIVELDPRDAATLGERLSRRGGAI